MCFSPLVLVFSVCQLSRNWSLYLYAACLYLQLCSVSTLAYVDALFIVHELHHYGCSYIWLATLILNLRSCIWYLLSV